MLHETPADPTESADDPANRDGAAPSASTRAPDAQATTGPNAASATAESEHPQPIDPADLATTLRVLAAMQDLDEDSDDFITVRRATAHMFKAVKKARRRELRDAVQDADRAVVAATATGAPDRIDDETRGIQLAITTSAPDRRHTHQVPRLLHLQEALHAGRFLLPPALPGLRCRSVT